MKKYNSVKIEIENFVKNNKKAKLNDIVEHFVVHGYKKRSLYRWANMILKNKSLKRSNGSGKPIVKGSKKNVAKIEKYFNHRSGRSQRRVARSIGCSQAYVNKILKTQTNVKCRKKLKRPLLTIQQKKAARPKCRRMANKFKNVDFIIDDESYFTLSHSVQTGNDRFYTDDIEKTPEDVKYKFQAKFEKKMLVWLAVSPRGISRPFFVPRNLSINQHIYREECIRKRLLPFIKKYHQDGKYIFWPDLASAHYANSVLNYLKTNEVKFLPKIDNPANVPKARPIEDFWANLKRIVYEGDWSARTITQLENRIKASMKKIDKTFLQSLMGSVVERLQKIARYGPYKI